MCTIGAVSNINRQGERLTFLIKTIDTFKTDECLHGYYRAANGKMALFTSIMGQHGINAGVNQQGLAIEISLSEYKENLVIENDDRRALANANILANCKSVDEGIELLKEFVPRYNSAIGGNHLLTDTNGGIALLEQCDGKFEYKMFTDRGYCGRGNNSHWLIQDKQSIQGTLEDSLAREAAMENFLKEVHENIPEGMSSSEIMKKAKSLLSLHSRDSNQKGSICVHGRKPSAPLLANLGDGLVYTTSAVILDISQLVMHYSLGFPCLGNWMTLKLAFSGQL